MFSICFNTICFRKNQINANTKKYSDIDKLTKINTIFKQ